MVYRKEKYNNSGKVYWITGLSGSGKTSLAKLLHQKLVDLEEFIIYLDGDILRDILGEEFGYTREDRLNLSKKYSRICSLLSDQGICVVCAFVALFHDIHKLNRNIIKDYSEIYLDVPLDVLMKRDQKKLYLKAKSGEIQNVVGIDIQSEIPLNPDMIIKNYGEMTPDLAVENILNHFYTLKS